MATHTRLIAVFVIITKCCYKYVNKGTIVRWVRHLEQVRRRHTDDVFNKSGVVGRTGDETSRRKEESLDWISTEKENNR